MEQIKNTLKRLDKGIVKMQDLEDLSKHTMSRTMTFNEANFGSSKSRWNREVEGKSDREKLDDPIKQRLASRLQLYYIEGKKKKSGTKELVPIHFTDEVCKSIKYLIKYRGSTLKMIIYLQLAIAIWRSGTLVSL